MTYPRLYLTEQSRANIKAAKKAVIEPTEGGFKVLLIGDKGQAYVENSGGVAVYKTNTYARNKIRKSNYKLFNNRVTTLDPTI